MRHPKLISAAIFTVFLLVGCGGETNDLISSGLTGPVQSIKEYDAGVSRDGEETKRILIEKRSYSREGFIESVDYYNNLTGEGTMRYEFTYYDNNKSKVMEITNSEDESISRWEFKINDQGAYTKCTIYSKDGEITEFIEYELTDDGDKIVKSVAYTMPDKEIAAVSEFDENENIVKRTSYGLPDEEGEFLVESEYGSNNIVSFVSFTQFDLEGNITSCQRNSYNENGWLKLMMHEDGDGELTYQDKFSYDDLDEQGNWLTCKIRSKSDGGSRSRRIVTRKIKYY